MKAVSRHFRPHEDADREFFRDFRGRPTWFTASRRSPDYGEHIPDYLEFSPD